MYLDFLVFFSPVLSLLLFFSFEKTNTLRWTVRLKGIGLVSACCFLVSLNLSIYVLAPWVFAVAPLQFFSLSEWQVPVWLSFMISILVLDFFHYLLHRVHHWVPLLWRLHRLHHSDRQVDVLTTHLHHPLEVLTMFLGVVLFAVVIDIPLIALTTYSLMLGLHSGFTHLNRDLPAGLDRCLKWLVVTPSFHRRHHFLNMKDGNSNFGLLFTCWDQIFRTATHKHGPEKEVFGISKYQAPSADSVGAYLANPLK